MTTPTIDQARDLLARMTPEELAEIDAMLSADPLPWYPLPGPQMDAYLSQADIVGYGGAAGGGKTDLIVGLALTAHKRALVVRREKAQTEGVIQRISDMLGGTPGFNSQKAIWRVPVGSQPLIEFGGLDNPGDERRWQGRAHDFKAFDEATEMREDQVRFIMGWTRSADPAQRTRVLMTFNPPTTVEGRWVIRFFAPWLDKSHTNPALPGELRWFTTVGDNPNYEVPDGRAFVLVDGAPCYDFDAAQYRAEDIIRPKSRTFIPARVTDNLYYAQTGYATLLQALPEPLRSQMLYGDFDAGIEDDPWQVIPTAWVQAAQARWAKPAKVPVMDSVGVDVARGGRDNTIIARRHGMWFDVPLTYPGAQTPDGPTVAGLVIASQRDSAVIHLDVIGVGASPYDFLREARQQIIGVNVSEAAQGTDKSGRLRFKNLRSELWWRMREALDPSSNTGICLPPDPRLLADLTAPTWSMSGATIQVASRDEIVAKIGRSPDFASAYVLALMDTPKLEVVRAVSRTADVRAYDPMAELDRARNYRPF